MLRFLLAWPCTGTVCDDTAVRSSNLQPLYCAPQILLCCSLPLPLAPIIFQPHILRQCLSLARKGGGTWYNLSFWHWALPVSCCLHVVDYCVNHHLLQTEASQVSFEGCTNLCTLHLTPKVWLILCVCSFNRIDFPLGPVTWSLIDLDPANYARHQFYLMECVLDKIWKWLVLLQHFITLLHQWACLAKLLTIAVLKVYRRVRLRLMITFLF